MNVQLLAKKKNENKRNAKVNLFTRSSRYVPHQTSSIYRPVHWCVQTRHTSVLLNSTALSLQYTDAIVISYVALRSAEKLSFWDYAFSFSFSLNICKYIY